MNGNSCAFVAVGFSLLSLMALVLSDAHARTRDAQTNLAASTVVYFGPSTHAALRGVRFGLSESNEASAAKPQILPNLKIVSDTEIVPFRAPVPVAVLAVGDAETLRLLVNLNPGVPVFNLAEEYDDLRALCLPTLLHIYPSRRMREDALLAWARQAKAEARTAFAWRADAVEPAAKQLNDRFHQAQGQDLDEAAWSGWTAARMLVQAMTRMRSQRTDALLRYLRHELAFDGHKGIPLSFRPNGQLRQPLWVVGDNRVLGIVPEPNGANNADLDRLGPGYCPQPASP